MNGVLNIFKPSGWTSHDVVAQTRALVHQRDIGHLGTLDPLATGVLPLVLGLATRLIEFSSYPKEYVTTCLLGKTTDSCDVTGVTLQEKEVRDLSVEKIEEEVLRLKQISGQIPPMVSAVKIKGRKLYELAREGIEVERKARPIRIESVEIIQSNPPRVTFRAAVSAGTYIRVLCQTLGENLGVGGCMEKLERTRVGPFPLAQATQLEDLKKLVKAEKVSDILLPSSLLVGHLPLLEMREKDLQGFCQGQKLEGATSPAGIYRVHNPEGRLSAIAEITAEGKINPKKVFGREGML